MIRTQKKNSIEVSSTITNSCNVEVAATEFQLTSSIGGNSRGSMTLAVDKTTTTTVEMSTVTFVSWILQE